MKDGCVTRPDFKVHSLRTRPRFISGSVWLITDFSCDAKPAPCNIGLCRTTGSKLCRRVLGTTGWQHAPLLHASNGFTVGRCVKLSISPVCTAMPGNTCSKIDTRLEKNCEGAQRVRRQLYRLPGQVNPAVLTCMSIIAVCTEYVPARQHECSCLINCQQDILPRSAESKESRELPARVRESLIRALAPRKTMYAEPSVYPT